MDQTKNQLAIERDAPDPDTPCVWLKVHGGLGDNIWLDSWWIR